MRMARLLLRGLDTRWRLVLVGLALLTHFGWHFDCVHASNYNYNYRPPASSLLPISLARVQCKAACLKKFSQPALDVRALPVAAGDLHSWCTSNVSCSNCYSGCEAPTLPTADVCATHCSSPNAAHRTATDKQLCSDSCKLLQTILASTPTFNTHLQFALINAPRETTVSSPNAIDEEAVRESFLEIEWSLPANSNMTGPVLFVLEARYCISPYFEEQSASQWKLLTMTTKLGVDMSDVKVGWRYQFRLAAVSSEGTRGYKQTAPVGLVAEPRIPTPPDNLTEVRTTLRSSKVDVEIRWDAPKQSDLEVQKYRIFWSKKLDDAQALVLSSKEYSRTTARNDLSYVIEDLEPDAVYSVSVLAIANYGNEEMVSPRATFYISTSAIASVNDTKRNGVSGAPKQLFPIIVNHTFYEEEDLRALVRWPMSNNRTNILRFHVSWRPLACIGEPSVSTKPLDAPTTDNRFAFIDRLIFDCRYEVVVRPITSDDRQLIPSTVTFDTPSCSKVQSRNGHKPKCADARPLPVLTSVSSTLIARSDRKYALNVSWRALARSANDISNYRIVWGRHSRQLPSSQKSSISNVMLLLKEPSPSFDKNDAVTIVLANNVSWYVIDGLEDNVFYNVEITARSADGDGQKAYLGFYRPANAELIAFSDIENEASASKTSRSVTKMRSTLNPTPEAITLGSTPGSSFSRLTLALCIVAYIIVFAERL